MRNPAVPCGPGRAALLAFALLAAAAAPAAASECETVPMRPFAETSPDLAAAQAAARAGKFDAAIARLESLLAAGGRTNPADDAVPAEGLHFLLGRVLEDAGRPDDALPHFARLARSVLSDAALYHEGLIRLETRDDVTGARAAFAGISPASPDWVDARLALADALTREGRPSLARVVLKDLFRDELPAHDLHLARVALVSVLEAQGESDAARAAALTAWMNAPDADSVRKAAALLARLDHEPTAEQQAVRAMVRGEAADLVRWNKWAKTAGRTAGKKSPGLAAAAAGAYALAIRKDPAAAVAAMRQARTDATDATLRSFATVQLATALAAQGDDPEARTLFEAALQEWPTGPFAAGAAVAAARSRMRLSDYDGAVAMLSRVSRDWPESGLDGRARWEMALAGLMAGRPDAALANLDDAASRMDRGHGMLFGLAEKVRYFRGVALHALGRADEALAEMDRVARGYPHSYYAVLAASRLVEWAGRRDPHVARATEAVSEAMGRATGVRVCDHARGPAMLWRLGYESEGLDTLKARARLGLLGEDGVALLATMVNGRRAKPGPVAREYLRGLPAAGTRDLFEAAYPLPWRDEVADATESTGVDPALVYAVMRTESNFEPSAKSPVGAVGLMQVMPASARMIAARILENPAAGKGIWKPARNVLLGTAFLGELERHFRGHLPLMLVAYNAGPGAARKFYRRLKDFPTDIFVEAVPYSATVAYVKKVIGLAAGYRAMYDEGQRGPILVPSALPETLGPFLERRKPEPRAQAKGPRLAGDIL